MKNFLKKIYQYAGEGDLVFSALGFGIILLFTRHSGIGVSPDSVIYLSTARNLAAHEGFRQFDHSVMVLFPAGYPVFLSIWIFFLQKDILPFAPFLNALLFALLIFLCGWMARKFYVSSRIYRYALLSCIVLSPCLLEIYSMLWSETLFLVLLAVFFIWLHHYVLVPSAKNFLIVSVIAALTCSTRYAGVTVIAAGSFWIWMGVREGIGKKIGRSLLFILISISLVLVNVWRNATIAGTATGQREAAVTPFRDNLQFFGNTFADWLPFVHPGGPAAFYTGIVLLLFFLILFFNRWLRSRIFFSYESILISFFLVYTFFILLSASISRYEQINSRLLAPAYIPMVFGATYLVPTFLNGKQKWKKILLVFLSLLLFLAFQRNQYRQDYETYDGVKDAGIPGYTEDDWQKAEIVEYIRSHREVFRKDVPVFSNADEALYFILNMKSETLPHKDITAESARFLFNHRFYLVLFTDGDNPDLINLDYIRRYYHVEEIKNFEDGQIYYATDILQGNKTVP